MRKPNSNSKLLSLPEEQQAKLADWLLSGIPYHVAQAQVEKEFGLRVSLGAFSAFWQSVCAPAYLAKRTRCVTMADEVASEASQRPGQFDAATIDALRQKSFELAVSANANPKDVKAIFSLLLKYRDQDLADRRVKLLEAKAAQLDSIKDVVSGAETPEEKQQKIRQIFGM